MHQVGPLPQQTYQQTVWPLQLLWLSPKIGQLIFLWQSLEDLEAGTASSRKASTFYGYWVMLKAGAKLPNWLIHTYPYYSILIHTIPYLSILFHTYPYYSILIHTIPYYSILFHTIPYLSILFHTIPYSSILFHTYISWSILINYPCWPLAFQICLAFVALALGLSWALGDVAAISASPCSHGPCLCEPRDARPSCFRSIGSTEANVPRNMSKLSEARGTSAVSTVYSVYSVYSFHLGAKICVPSREAVMCDSHRSLPRKLRISNASVLDNSLQISSSDLGGRALISVLAASRQNSFRWPFNRCCSRVSSSCLTAWELFASRLAEGNRKSPDFRGRGAIASRPGERFSTDSMVCIAQTHSKNQTNQQTYDPGAKPTIMCCKRIQTRGTPRYSRTTFRSGLRTCDSSLVGQLLARRPPFLVIVGGHSESQDHTVESLWENRLEEDLESCSHSFTLPNKMHKYVKHWNPNTYRIMPPAEILTTLVCSSVSFLSCDCSAWHLS